MKTTPAYSCICQDCSTVFGIDKFMINVINFDDDDETAIDFLSGSVNKISCPLCKADFTYEIPMLIFSNKHNFAIKVDPHTPSDLPSSPTLLGDIFKVFPYKYRQVTYQIEAIEKVRIFLDGFDDKYIELIKAKYFPDSDATPMQDINLCYKASDKNTIYFEKLDYNGKLIKEFEFLKSQIVRRPTFKGSSNHCWHKINRYTIEDYIDKEK